jgi:Tol biopolymer transport system component
MVTSRDVAKIMDFGLAKLKGVSRLTRTGSTVGTVAYMSPEQVRGEELDARSDIFSFGVVLYEMATRCQAFQGSTSAMVFDSILHKTPSSPRSLNSKIPEELERITFKALEKDREVRYQSAKEVFADLKRLKRDSDSEKLKAQAGVRFSFPRRIPRVGWISGSIILIIFAVLFLFWNRSAFFHRDSLLGKTAHHRITFTGDALMPAVSPDGLFVSYIAGKRGDPQRLMLQDLAGNPPVKLIDSYYLRAPRWSPDGSQILVCDVQLGEGGFAFPSILLVPRLGQSSRRIADGASACWSPDGTEIAIGFAAGKGPGFRLVNALTGVVREIPLSGFRIVADLDWSRTANRLLILGLLDKGRAIWTVRPDGTDLTKLVEEQEIACARWSSSGDAIYYLRNAGSTPELAKIPIASSPAKSEPSVLLGGLEAGEYFTLSSNGARLLYTRAQASSNLWLAEFTLNAAENKTKTRALTSGTSSLGQPSISPDGKWIAFVNMRENANIYRMPIDGGQSTQLTFTSGFAPAWSPDGTQIAFGSTEGGKNRVWTVRADGLSRRALNKTILSDNYQLTWAPGRRILYQVPSADNFKILDPVTGEEEFLLKGGFLGWIFNPRYSPDGTIVAVWWNRKVRSEIGIYLISLKDRSVKALTKGDIRPVSWSPDGNTVYAFRSFTGEIVAIPVAGGNPRNVLTLPGRITDATVSLDGRKIVGSVAEEKSDVWLMENFDPHP